MRITITVNGEQFVFCYCPVGQFIMGSPQSEYGRWPVETQRKVILTEEFWILDSAVTVAQWESVMKTNFHDHLEAASKNKSLMKIAGNVETIVKSLERFSKNGLSIIELNRTKVPVTMVNWYDAFDFCRCLSLRLEKGYLTRLPTEAEWEYACRAGTTGATYGGNLSENHAVSNTMLDSICWNSENCGFSKGTRSVGTVLGPQEVRQKKPNAWNLYDTIGNVWEWTNDWYAPYSEKEEVNPTGPVTGKLKVPKGGSWMGPLRTYRAANRGWDDPMLTSPFLGFRPILKLKTAT